MPCRRGALTDERLDMCARVSALGTPQLVLLPAAAVAAGRAGRLARGCRAGQGPPQGHAEQPAAQRGTHCRHGTADVTGGDCRRGDTGHRGHVTSQTVNTSAAL